MPTMEMSKCNLTKEDISFLQGETSCLCFVCSCCAMTDFVYMTSCIEFEHSKRAAQEKNIEDDALDYEGSCEESSDDEEFSGDVEEDSEGYSEEEEEDSESDDERSSAFGMFANFGIITRAASRMTSAVLLISVLFVARFVSTQGMQKIVTLKSAKLWSES